MNQEITIAIIMSSYCLFFQVEPNNNMDSSSPLLTKIKIEEGEYGEGMPEVYIVAIIANAITISV